MKKTQFELLEKLNTKTQKAIYNFTDDYATIIDSNEKTICNLYTAKNNSFRVHISKKDYTTFSTDIDCIKNDKKCAYIVNADNLNAFIKELKKHTTFRTAFNKKDNKIYLESATQFDD